MKRILKQRWIASILFIIGALHVFIIRQTYRPNAHLQHVTLTYDDDADLIINSTALSLPSPPTRIVVLGERASGVNEIVQVLTDAFDNTIVSRHKHIHRNTLLNNNEIHAVAKQTDILWVIAVNSPCEWAEAMIRLKQRVCFENTMFQNTYRHYDSSQSSSSLCNGDDVLQQDTTYNYKWDDWPDIEHGIEIIPTDNNTNKQQSSSTGNTAIITHATIFEMRKRNLLITQQIISSIHPRHVKIVRTREFVLNPMALIQDLVKEYNFNFVTREDDNTVVSTGSLDTASPSLSLCMSQTKWKEAQSFIDWKIESNFGHHPLDCRLCYDEYRDEKEAPSVIYLLGECIIYYVCVCIVSAKYLTHSDGNSN